MPRPNRKGKAGGRPGRVEIAREQHDVNHDRRHARAGQQRRDAAHGERHQERAAARLPHQPAAAVTGK